METALQVCRFCHFAATMALFGAIAFRCYAFVGIDGDGPSWFDVRLARYESAAAIVALLSAGALLVCVTGSMAGATSAAFDPATLGAVLFDTGFGAVWRWRLLLAAALVAVCLRPRWRRPTLLLLLSGVLLASLGWVGHAAMGEGQGHRAQGQPEPAPARRRDLARRIAAARLAAVARKKTGRDARAASCGRYIAALLGGRRRTPSPWRSWR